MSEDERYDIVIIGGGHNGTAAAAYLSKCGLSVCVLEERLECGGAQENAEPLAGMRVFPHAIIFYGAPAPGFDQLELWKYGFRVQWNPVLRDITRMFQELGTATTEGPAKPSEKDVMGYAKLSGLSGQFTKELLRATFWCPPPPPEVEVSAETIPFMQVYKERQPDIWTEELLEGTLFDVMDEFFETEPFKTTIANAAWWSGAAAHWEGVAIPAFGGGILTILAGGVSIPRGGMHGYYHSIFRCAVAHGTVFRTCCPVDEIIIRNGRAVGVRLRDNAAWGGKKIWADKAVISAVDIKQTFLKLAGPQQMDPSFLQKVKDINVKGGSPFISHFLTRKPLRFRPKFKAMGEPVAVYYPCDSREFYYEHIANTDGWKGNLWTIPPERVTWFMGPWQTFDPTDCQYPGNHPKGYCSPPMEINITPPDYHVEGPDAIERNKDKMKTYVRQALSQVFEGLDDDNVIQHLVVTPYDAEFRNTSMIGGHYCGSRHCKDQWLTQRPLAGMGRYRTPIERLYLCNHTSGHPGCLCLMAVPYNLMHILIEDGICEPGDWWYPSPWYIPERGKISAIPRQGKV